MLKRKWIGQVSTIIMIWEVPNMKSETNIRRNDMDEVSYKNLKPKINWFSIINTANKENVFL